jgi:hypothetical protein
VAPLIDSISGGTPSPSASSGAAFLSCSKYCVAELLLGITRVTFIEATTGGVLLLDRGGGLSELARITLPSLLASTTPQTKAFVASMGCSIVLQVAGSCQKIG